VSETPSSIGRVTRCSIRGFAGATQLPETAFPSFGDFCRAEMRPSQTAGKADAADYAVGLIYDLSVQDDELARQLAAADEPTAEQLLDSQLRRSIPVEISALTVGHRVGGAWLAGLPPQPPLTLSRIYLLDGDEVRAFTRDLRFLRHILAADAVSQEDLLEASLQRAALAQPAPARDEFVLRAGRECARRLGHDLPRLEAILERLHEL